jgi:hypothetical protein
LKLDRYQSREAVQELLTCPGPTVGVKTEQEALLDVPVVRGTDVLDGSRLGSTCASRTVVNAHLVTYFVGLVALSRSNGVQHDA